MRLKRKTIRVMAGCIAGLLAFVMLFGLVADLFFRTDASAAASQSAVNELKDKLEASNEEKAKLKEQLDSMDRDKATLKTQIDTLDRQIANTEEQIELRNELISSLQGQIEQKEVELAAAQQEKDEQYEKFKARVRVMYEHGDTSYLEVLLSSESISDFLFRYEAVSQIAQYDKNLFEELKALEEEVAQAKAALESDKQAEVEARQELQQTKSQLDSQLSQREQSMAELQAASEEVAASYAEIEKEEQSIQAEIDRMAKELAEQEAARQQQNNGGGTVQVSGGYTYPLPSGYRKVTSRFAMREHPVTGVYKQHTGVDVSAPRGTTIMAAKSGTVIIAGRSTAYGNYVVINHGGGLTTLYAHMSKITTTKGATVSAGDKIGEVGSTGYSTGNHLHFEVRINGAYQDAGRILGLY